MIRVDKDDEAVGQLNFLKFGRVEVHTNGVIAINFAPRVDDRTVKMSTEISDSAIEASERG